MSEQDDRLRDLGSELPFDRPDPARRDAVRSALLVAAADRTARPSGRWYLVGGAFAAGALAAAAALLLLVGEDDGRAPTGSAARIESSPAAQVERKVTRTPTGVDEVVRVRAGTLKLAVGALRAGDHVRVATRDAEVEGEGRYDVVVVDDTLQAVIVAEGHATIRITGQQSVFLSTGQSWQAQTIVAHEDVARAADAGASRFGAAGTDVGRGDAPNVAAADVGGAAAAGGVPAPGGALAPVPAAAPAPAAPSAPAASTSRSRPSRASAPRNDVAAAAAPRAKATATPPHASPAATEPPSPAEPPSAATAAAAAVASSHAPVDVPADAAKRVERLFQSGMSLLKANKHAEAARELLAAADAGGNDPLAADARYFAAVALTKAGRKTEAERALVGFLDAAPTSIRRGRAAVMLARLVAERGDSTTARAWFESALIDADPSVVAAARAGIAALR